MIRFVKNSGGNDCCVKRSPLLNPAYVSSTTSVLFKILHSKAKIDLETDSGFVYSPALPPANYSFASFALVNSAARLVNSELDLENKMSFELDPESSEIVVTCQRCVYG